MEKGGGIAPPFGFQRGKKKRKKSQRIYKTNASEKSPKKGRNTALIIFQKGGIEGMGGKGGSRLFRVGIGKTQ